VTKRDEFAEHRIFLLRMGVSTKEVDKRLEGMRNERARLAAGDLPPKSVVRPALRKGRERM